MLDKRSIIAVVRDTVSPQWQKWNFSCRNYQSDRWIQVFHRYTDTFIFLEEFEEFTVDIMCQNVYSSIFSLFFFFFFFFFLNTMNALLFNLSNVLVITNSIRLRCSLMWKKKKEKRKTMPLISISFLFAALYLFLICPEIRISSRRVKFMWILFENHIRYFFCFMRHASWILIFMLLFLV